MRKNWNLVSLLCILGVFFAVSLTGCASVTTGTTQSVTINTNPSGATCTLSREGSTIAVVNPTPGSVTVDKDKDTISVICQKGGYQDAAGTLAAEVQGMTFGNILLGGVIGVVVDAASGAMHKYQPMLSLLLIPNEFRSVTERNTFFDGMKADYIADSSKKLSGMAELCEKEQEDRKPYCLTQVKEAETARDNRLAEIENMRSSAKMTN